MDAVTYPHESVESELRAHWLMAKVDVSVQKSVATRLGVSAIPVAVAVSEDGVVLGRVLGFVEPGPFAAALARLRQGRY